jgi:putative hydrolase of the HAD superfamily
MAKRSWAKKQPQDLFLPGEFHLVGQGVRAIVFDAVGTVIHPDPPAPIIYAEVGRRYGSRLTPAIIGKRFSTAFAQEEALDRVQGWRTSESREVERWRRIVTTVLDDVTDADACFQALFEHFGRPQAWICAADAGATIAELTKRGFILGMASNYDRRLHSVVAGFVALQPLQHRIISSEVGWRKPAPEFFASLRRVVGLSGEEILYVGDDWANDYQGARTAGLQAVLLDPREKQPSSAIPRIQRLGDLLRADDRPSLDLKTDL